MSYYYINVTKANNPLPKSIVFAGGGYEINLDHRKLKTPSGSIFKVPNEALAMAVCQEWGAQQKTIKRLNMHMVT